MTKIFTKTLIGGLIMASTVLTAPAFAQNGGFGSRVGATGANVRTDARLAYQRGDTDRRERSQARREYRRESNQDRRDYQRERADDRRDYRNEQRNNRQDWQQNRWDNERRSNDNRYQNRNQGGVWSNNWRSDSRYDWQRYRAQNRNTYRMGTYYSPYRDRSYSRVRVGISLNSGYYGQRYWIGNPWQYRLPSVPGYMRWVRYHDDVVLVDLRTGRVRDVIYNFFW